MVQVSSAAVSRYMNGGYVSEEKKEDSGVIEETGYRPSVQRERFAPNESVPGQSDCSKDQFRVDQQDYRGNRSGTFRAYQMLLTITDNDPSKELEYMVV